MIPDASLVADLPPFRLLSRTQLHEILGDAHAGHVHRGEAVFRQGDLAERFYLLLDGHLLVERLSPAGDRVIPLQIPPGQLFGLAVALGRDDYPATAVAATDCVALSWPSRLWAEYTGRYEGFATEVYRVVGARFEEMNTRVMELATQKVEQRVACAVLRLSRQNGQATDGGVEIDFPLTRRQLSEMTGSTLHTVSRLMATWEAEGILESRHKRVLVRNPAGLETLAGDSADQT